MKLKLIVSAILASAALINNAQALEITKPIVSSVPITDSTALAANTHSSTKEVYLIGLNLTPKQIQHFQNKPSNFHSTSNLPAQVQLGMNNTPVLDQGIHGTCVTFAVTAAYDALLGKGDYASQLCSLELGQYTEKNGYTPSGWEGTFGSVLLAKITESGIVAKSHESSAACGGLRAYPSYSSQIGQAMAPTSFKSISEDVSNVTYFEPILTAEESSDPAETIDNNNVLYQVKSALVDGSKDNSRRIVFGVIVPYQHCMTGACGTFHAKNDSWTLSHEIQNDKNPQLAGHEMVITGYDDNAVSVDADGMQHKGLLTLRNSWSALAGDKGDFYMSYDYFTKYVLEAHTLVKGSL